MILNYLSVINALSVTHWEEDEDLEPCSYYITPFFWRWRSFESTRTPIPQVYSLGLSLSLVDKQDAPYRESSNHITCNLGLLLPRPSANQYLIWPASSRLQFETNNRRIGKKFATNWYSLDIAASSSTTKSDAITSLSSKGTCRAYEYDAIWEPRKCQRHLKESFWPGLIIKSYGAYFRDLREEGSKFWMGGMRKKIVLRLVFYCARRVLYYEAQNKNCMLIV